VFRGFTQSVHTKSAIEPSDRQGTPHSTSFSVSQFPPYPRWMLCNLYRLKIVVNK